MKKRLTIRSKIIVNTITLVLLSLICSGTCFIWLQYQTLKRDTFQRIEGSIGQMSLAMSDKFALLDSSSFALLASPSMRSWNMGRLVFSPDDPAYFTKVQTVQDEVSANLMFNHAWLSKYIDAIYIFADGQQIRLCTRLPLSLTYTNEEFRQVYENTKSQTAMSFYHMAKDSEGAQTYLIRRMNDTMQQKQLTLIFSLNEVELSRELCSDELGMNASVLYEDTFFFSSNPTLIGQRLFPHIGATAESTSFIQTRQLSPELFSIYVSVPYNAIYDPLLRAVLPYIIFGLLTALAFGTLAGMSATAYTRFVNELLTNIERLKRSDFDTLMPAFKEPELNEISQTFNRMTSEIKRLFNHIYQSELLLKDADIKLLQSQISPHFLINTLTTIGTRAMLNGDKETYQMTAALSTMLDAGLHNTREQSSFVPLSEELTYINCYLTLQQIRFTDKLRYEIDVTNEALLQLYIPRLSIEPFVENAVIHGVGGNLQGGEVKITIYREGEMLCAAICDNGRGFDVVTVMNGQLQPDKAGHHIGIANTNKRIQLLFGKEYGVSFESIPMVKTVALVRLPIMVTPPDKGGL